MRYEQPAGRGELLSVTSRVHSFQKTGDSITSISIDFVSGHTRHIAEIGGRGVWEYHQGASSSIVVSKNIV